MKIESGGGALNLFGRPISTSLLVLLLILFCRGVSLEIGDLIDPTETRYAVIAQNMLLSGDWITPRLPTETGLELYFSKPPLHYWLTALAYKLFGIDEWTSRLPSYLGLLLIIISMLIYSERFLDRKAGYIAGIVCTSSPLMLILAGSSTIDVTFSGFTSAALVAFAITLDRYQSGQKSTFAGLSCSVFTALAFLTKGPAAVIMIGIPILALFLLKRELSVLKCLPWFRGALLFLTICLPWFYFIEQANPGSVKYFFMNENFLRFLIKDYGGKYGAAHIKPYGSIWWMWGLSMLPWSLFLARALLKNLINCRTLRISSANQWSVLMLAWGLTPMIFFTFARSILPAYVIPGIPGLALYLAHLMHTKQDSQPVPNSGINPTPKPITNDGQLYIHEVALGMTCLFLLALIPLATVIESNKSAENILKVIAENIGDHKPIVATTSIRDLSPFWTSTAYERELSKKLKVVYANPNNIKRAKYANLIIRNKSGTLPSSVLEHYEKRASQGSWHWYSRIPRSSQG